MIHGHQPLPVGMNSGPASTLEDFFGGGGPSERVQRKKRLVHSILRLSNMAFAFRPSPSATSSLGNPDPTPDLEAGLGGETMQRGGKSGELRQGEGKGEGDPLVGKLAPSGGSQDGGSMGGTVQGAGQNDDVSMTMPARYSTLSGWPTASGAHTYEEVSKWLHERYSGIPCPDCTVRLAIAVEDTGAGQEKKTYNSLKRKQRIIEFSFPFL